jgi:predicted ATP-dependent endonuclease of OLD family
MNAEGLKVLDIKIKNFKNITKREVQLDGKSILLIGPNKIGKSSFIQAINSPLDAKYVPLTPVKTGEEKGEIHLKIGGHLKGEDLEYIVSCYFSAENSKGKVIIKNKEGDTLSGGRNAVEDIIGNIGFDIFEFIRKGRTATGKISTSGVKEQIETLKELMPKETLKKLYALDHKKNDIYKNRTQINSEINFLEGQLKSQQFTVEEIEKYSLETSAEEITDSIRKAAKINANIDACIEVVNSTDKKNKESLETISSLEAKIEELKKQIEQEKKTIENRGETLEKAQTYMKKFSKIDTTELNEKFNKIGEHNKKVEQVKQLKSQQEILAEKKKASESITKEIELIEKQKKEIFKSGNLPVPGLEFDDENILYNGLPLNEEQIPTSQLISVGLKIGMAMNPNLRLLVVRDGSLLDEDTLNEVLRICNEENYQLIIEMVEKRDIEEPAIEFVEK